MNLLLNALSCAPVPRPPVWLMRQAGRYMPAYRALRERYSLWDMFHRPELAAEVTLFPIEWLDVDAAILFSDILVVAECLGLQLTFPSQGGPRVFPTVTPMQVDHLPLLPVEKSLSYVFETIALVKQKLLVPLIGFCGGPFTVATYCIDAESSQPFFLTRRWIEEDPKSFHRLLEKLTRVSIDYITAQVRAGAVAIQIFDSWANILSDEQFELFCLPYLQRLVDAVKSKAPVILFCRDSSKRHAQLTRVKPSCISLDEQCSMAEMRKILPAEMAIQGNVAPLLLKQPPALIEQHVEKLLTSLARAKGVIINLGHGVLPDTPLHHVQCFVNAVRFFSGSENI